MSDLIRTQIVGFLMHRLIFSSFNMSRLVGKPTICICENKDADQLPGNREADQRLCFRYTDSTFPLLSKSKISSLYLSSVLAQLGLCRTCSETTLLVFPRGGSYVVMTILLFIPQYKDRTHVKNNLIVCGLVAASFIYSIESQTQKHH